MYLKDEIIFATDTKGEEITLKKVRQWINNSNQVELANLFYDRLFSRYIMPYSYDSSEYKMYKSGFAIMTSCCLLIETYASFVQPLFRDTRHKSERCFGWFFNEYEDFKPFASGGLAQGDYLKVNEPIKNKGLPRDFYINVRCGILHNGETRQGWRIRRDGVLFDAVKKSINATMFLNSIHGILSKHKDELLISNINTKIWSTYLTRLNDLIIKS